MAAPMELLASKLKNVTLCTRILSSRFKQTSRSCHISVQEPAPSITKSKRTQMPFSLTSLEKSLKSTGHRILSDRISSATTAFPFGVIRPYSALPQRAIFTTPVWQSEESENDSGACRKCWNCGRETDPLTELFFCVCGVVQKPAGKVTFFTLLGVDEAFDLDVKKLSEVYKHLQKHLHPDKFNQKSETEQSLAEEQSSLLNKAYFTLLKPLPRALYLLELHGYVIEEGSTSMDPEFLMEVLDLNERIGESSTEDIKEIEEDISSKIQQNTELMSHAFAEQDYDTARDIAVRLKYYVNVESKVKSFYRSKM
ncbi:iron-sulfur cluster co-chaperone protein HscB-like [Babylonia areolata]|uniref:iron-sulfur cluster co-chaperone protein HscB-like n=1 Tax=Babylonia areolata TaxID=304850 RepID=UPI003FD66551